MARLNDRSLRTRHFLGAFLAIIAGIAVAILLHMAADAAMRTRRTSVAGAAAATVALVMAVGRIVVIIAPVSLAAAWTIPEKTADIGEEATRRTVMPRAIAAKVVAAWSARIAFAAGIAAWAAARIAIAARTASAARGSAATAAAAIAAVVAIGDDRAMRHAARATRRRTARFVAGVVVQRTAAAIPARIGTRMESAAAGIGRQCTSH